MELVRCETCSKWDALVSASPQGTIFCRTDFLKALNVGYELWWVVENGRAELGALLLVDQHGEASCAPFSFSLYHGILFDGCFSTLPPHTAVQRGLELVEFLLHNLKEHYRRISFCLHPAFPDVRGFTWFHYHEPDQGQFNVEVNYTGWIELNGVSDFDSYLTKIRKVRRYEGRKALREGGWPFRLGEARASIMRGLLEKG